MKSLGVLVGEKGLWTFFNDIFNYLDSLYNINIFAPPKAYNLPLLSGRLNRWVYHQRIRSILRQNDITFFEWASEYLQIASHLPKYAPIVTRMHSFELYDWAPKINWDHVDKIIFISDNIRKKFIKQYPNHSHKTTLVYNAISLEKFKPVQRDFDFSIGMLGTIAPIKRVYEIIFIIKELQDLGYNPTLHIAGGKIHKDRDDRYYIAVQQAVKKLKLQNVVKFYGHVDDPSEWFQNIDIFISNSYWEGLQTSLLEAMASGCYCLSHFWDGVEEALPEEYVFSTELELKEKLVEYSNLPEVDRVTQSKKLRSIVDEKFNIETNKKMIGDVLASIS